MSTMFRRREAPGKEAPGQAPDVPRGIVTPEEVLIVETARDALGKVCGGTLPREVQTTRRDLISRELAKVAAAIQAALFVIRGGTR